MDGLYVHTYIVCCVCTHLHNMKYFIVVELTYTYDERLYNGEINGYCMLVQLGGIKDTIWTCIKTIDGIMQTLKHNYNILKR